MLFLVKIWSLNNLADDPEEEKMLHAAETDRAERWKKKIFQNLMRNIKKSFKTDYEYQTWKLITPNPMKNYPGPTWQAEKEFCESAHLVFVCRPWKEEHILKVLLPYLTSWWQKMMCEWCVWKKFTWCTSWSFLHILHS